MSKLSTLFVRELVFTGVHGSTGREPTDPQQFEVNIEMQIDTSRSASSDLLSDTYDYKNARTIAENVIEKENHILIERIASRIAERICNDPKFLQFQ